MGSVSYAHQTEMKYLAQLVPTRAAGRTGTSSIMVQLTARTEQLELVAKPEAESKLVEIYAADSITMAEGLLSIAGYETVEGVYQGGEAYTLKRPLYTFGQVTPEHYWSEWHHN